MNYNYFTELNYRADRILQYYTEERLNSLPLIPYFGFTGAPLGPHIYLQDKLLHHINKHFAILYAGVIKLDPYTIYDWHTDTKRTVALNMLLTGHKSSYSIFKRSQAGVVINTTHLDYKTDTLYVFNTQQEHMVVNTYENRWLFTVEFQDEILYDDMVLWIKENGYGK